MVVRGGEKASERNRSKHRMYINISNIQKIEEKVRKIVDEVIQKEEDISN